MIVIDASAVVALLVDAGQMGEAVAAVVTEHDLAYPSLMPYEVASALRRLEAAALIPRSLAGSAVHGVQALHGQVFEWSDVAARQWELRHNLSAYDAAYVALAETLDVPLLTLDARLRHAPGTRCQFMPLSTGDGR